MMLHISGLTHTQTHTLEFLQWESYAADYNVFKLSVRSRATDVFARSIQWMQVSGRSLKCQIIFTFCTWWFVFNFVRLSLSDNLLSISQQWTSDACSHCLCRFCWTPLRLPTPVCTPSVQVLLSLTFFFLFRSCSWLDATPRVNQLGRCVKSCVGLLQQDWIQVFF